MYIVVRLTKFWGHDRLICDATWFTTVLGTTPPDANGMVSHACELHIQCAAKGIP